MKISNSSQRNLGIVLSYVNMALQIVISLVYTPIMLNLLGQSEYGLYSLSNSTISYLNILSLGIGGAYTRYYIRYKVANDDDGIKKLNGMYILFYLIASGVSLIAGVALVSNLDKIFISLNSAELNTMKILMALLVVNLAISFPCTLFTNYIIANEHFVIQRLLLIAKTTISPLVVIPVLLSGHGSVGYTAVTVTVNIAIEIVSVIYALKHLKMKFSFKKLKFSLMKEIFIFSFFILLNQIIDQVNSNMGTFLLGIYQGSVAVAVYGVAKTITNYFFTFSTTISSVYAPKVNQMVAQNTEKMEITKLMTKVGRVQFIIMALILSGLIFFGKPFVHLWAGSEYNDAYYIIIILCTPVLVPLIQNIGIEIQRAMNKHQIRSIAYGIMAAFNIAISIPMIKIYGVIGAALGTCISYIACNIIFMNIYYHHSLKLDMIYFWKEIFKFTPSLILPIGLGIFITHSSFNLYTWKNLFLAIILYVLIYCISLWLLGMNKSEKAIANKLIKRIRK